MTVLPMVVEWITCKLIFPFGTITEDGVKQLLSKYTEEFSVANFYADREVGCNRTTFAIVDIPHKVIHKLVKDSKIKEIDPMQSYSKKPKQYDDCSGGGCGSCGCGG